MRCSRPIPRATGPPTASSRGTGSRALTSSTCATGPPRAAGTSVPRRRRCRPTSWRARARATWRPTNGSPASPSTPGSRERLPPRVPTCGGRREQDPRGHGCPRAGARADPPQGGHPRPAGGGGRARPAGAGLQRGGQRAHRPHGRARARGAAAARGDVREAPRQPARGGLRGGATGRQQQPRRRGGRQWCGRLSGEAGAVKFGVLQFPGSCDEVDALHAARRVGDAQLLWHGERDLHGVDAIIIPGGFSYGDYLRAGAIARFAPAMESVIAFADDGGLVLGICNGFQVLCEAHLLPGALLVNANRRFTFRQVEVEVRNAGTAFTRACSEGQRLSIPAKHSWGRYYADERTLEAIEARGQLVLRYAPG